MCRIAAYVGPPLPLSTVLYDAPYSLSEQAHSPREMYSGRVNVDGTGIAWWPAAEEDAPPIRYVSERPPWSDPNLPALASRLRAVMAVAAIRNASPGVPYGVGNVAPFVHAGFAGAHNGFLGKFREQTGRELTSRLPDHLYAAVDAISDSLIVFLTVVRHYEEHPERGLAEALRTATLEILNVCADADAPATLNVVVADGRRLAAVRTARGTEGNNPLYLRQGGRVALGGTFFGSEPLDGDDGWEAIADDSVVEGDADGMTTTHLKA